MGIRIGISGWTYKPWRGTFYPEGVKQREELAYASRQVNSIEINGSFYSLQTPGSYEKWREAVPGDFVFSVSVPRYITHIRRLKEVEKPVANFLASGVLALKGKLGAILWQFPPSLKFDEGRFEEFFKMLPRDTKGAAKMARGHDGFLKEVYTRCDENRAMRHAIEVRHESFEVQGFVKMAREYGVAIVVADTAGKWPLIEEETADFIYVRLHGDEELYVSGYTEEALDLWGKKVKKWGKKGDVYVYFDNDVKVRAPVDARGLMRRVGVDFGAFRD